MLINSKIVPIVSLVHIVTCFYFVRPLHSLVHRALLTIVPCMVLTYFGCQNLPLIHLSSMMTVTLYWMFSIRLVDLIVFLPNKTLSFQAFVGKFLWFLFPVVECNSNYPIIFDLILAGTKLLLNHWVCRWFIMCEPSDSYGKMGMFYLYMCTGTFAADAQIALVRSMTRNKYTLLSFNDLPFLSGSLREFWGRRYNRLVSSLLRESIFKPVRRLFSMSSTISALLSFTISGLLHAHVAGVVFGASSVLPAFIFFLLQGIACSVETFCPINVPKPIGIVLTHVFLLFTTPLYVGLITRAIPNYFAVNPSPLLNVKWLPQLPLPNFCPK